MFDAGYIDEFGSCSEEVDLAAPIVGSNIDCPYKSNEIVADKFESHTELRPRLKKVNNEKTCASRASPCGFA